MDQMTEAVMSDEQQDEQDTGAKLTDINYDCLELIFKRLRFEDMLNLADTCIALRNAIETKLKKYIKYVRIEEICFNSAKSIQNRGWRFCIADFKSSLQLLRCFGHYIEVFYIRDDRVSHQNLNIKICDYLNEYCSNSVKKIGIHLAITFSMKYNKNKPFTKLTRAFFSYITLGHSFKNFNKMCPNLEDLSFNDIRLSIDQHFTTTKIIEQHFPKLRKLQIKQTSNEDYWNSHSSSILKESHVGNLLRLNPKISDLNIGGHVLNANFLRKISEHLQSIKVFGIHWCDAKSFYTKNVIHLKSVESLYIHVNSLRTLPMISFLFDKLKQLDLRYAQLNTDFIDFVRRHPTITKLTISFNGFISYEEGKNILELARALPSVEELFIYNKAFSIDKIITLISECKTLKMFEFKIETCAQTHSEIHAMLNAQISDNWRIASKYERYILKRLNN